jgi:hypothetical protein
MYPPDLVVVDSDTSPIAPFLSCPAPERLRRLEAPADGVHLDLRLGGQGPFDHCLQIHGVTACPEDRSLADLMNAESDVLFVQVAVPGRAGHELLGIGLAGDGIAARTTLYSLRAA